MEQVFKEFFTAIKEKISSPFFRYFSISWILWNWKFIYFLFFVDEKLFFEEFKILKFTYLIENSFYEGFWWWWFFLLFPILSALFFIFIFPWFNKFFLESHIWTIWKESDIKMDHRRKIKKNDLEIAEVKLEEKKIEEKILKEENKIKKEKQSSLTEEEKWDKDFNDFIKNSASTSFPTVMRIIYENNGFNFGNSLRLKWNIIAIFDSYWLILSEEKRKDVIWSSELSFRITDKWKYFWKKYQVLKMLDDF